METKAGIQSVDRAIKILSLFNHRRPRLGITEISRIFGLPKGTVHGLVRTLLKAGFLEQELKGRKYRLGLKIYEMGMTLVGNLEINQKAAGSLNKLSKRCRLVSRMAVWDGDSVLIILTIDPHFTSPFFNQIGPRIPGYSTAVGKAILAFLDEQALRAYLGQTALIPYTPKTLTQRRQLLSDLEKTRQRGYSMDQEETVSGLFCIGAPIFGQGGNLVASISLSGNPQHFTGKRLQEMSERLLKAAGEISGTMGHFPRPLDLKSI
jgi:DNA-binding IclR family transcriptional regulator